MIKQKEARKQGSKEARSKKQRRLFLIITAFNKTS
jgi:hypothetical protein